MKRFWLLLVLLWGVQTAACASTRYSEEFVTGKEWLTQMSAREKFMSLIPPAILFSDYDVNLKLSLPQYIFLIDRVMKGNPRLENEGLDSIFASTIYLFEPENREALKTMEMNFLRGELENKPLHSPRLTVDDLLKEVSS